MTTEIEATKELTPLDNKITEIEKNDENNNKKEEDKQLTNDEALDIQMKFLNSSMKNILGSIIENEPDPMSLNYENDIKNKNLDKGIFLYLQNIHNNNFCNEINYIFNSINGKISYINDKNKEFLQNKKFIEREINAISQEKIDCFNEKENLDKELELLNLNAMSNSFMNQSVNLNLSTNFNNNSDIDEIELAQKTKKIEGLKKKYNKIFDNITANKKEFPIIKNKNSMLQGENMVLNEKLKQKQLIWEQLRKENERVKTVVIKRSYLNIETENNNKKDKNVKKDGKETKVQTKNIKVSKIGSFLGNMFKKKK
jgi:hypothetical protein